MTRIFKRLKTQVEGRTARGERPRWVPLKVEVYETFGSLLELYDYVLQERLNVEGDNPTPATVNLAEGYADFRAKLEAAVKK